MQLDDDNLKRYFHKVISGIEAVIIKLRTTTQVPAKAKELQARLAGTCMMYKDAETKIPHFISSFNRAIG